MGAVLLERLHAAAEQHVGAQRVPGLVALVGRREQVHVEVLGELTVGGAPMARDSIFRIASTTKPITAAATLAVVGEGLIGLDEPVDRLVPELAGRRVLGPGPDFNPFAPPGTLEGMPADLPAGLLGPALASSADAFAAVDPSDMQVPVPLPPFTLPAQRADEAVSLLNYLGRRENWTP